MTSTDVRPTEPAAAGRSDAADPSLLRLTAVELRKSADTRAGRWLLITVALLSLGMGVLQLFFAPPQERTLAGFLDGQQLATNILLPVVGILLVTSEWSQRSAMTTFALVPRRSRVAVAKAAACTVLALVAFAVTAVVAVAAYALSAVRGDITWAQLDWSVPTRLWPQLALLIVIGVLGGVAFGLALQSSPLAIVLYFLLPIVFGIVVELVEPVRQAARWVDLNVTSALMTPDMTSQHWAYLGTAVLVWVALPAVVGFVRLTRSEVT